MDRSSGGTPWVNSSVEPTSLVYKYKLVILGDEKVGKTSILNRLMEDSYELEYNATVGVDFFSKTMNVGTDIDRWVRLQIWDTAGQQRFRDSILNYIRDSHLVVVVYDVSNRKSFENTMKWVKDVREVRGNDILIALIGNKTDVRHHETKVSTLEGMECAEKNGYVLFMECSAKAGYNIKQLFNRLSEYLPQDMGDTSIRDVSSRAGAHTRARRQFVAT